MRTKSLEYFLVIQLVHFKKKRPHFPPTPRKPESRPAHRNTDKHTRTFIGSSHTKWTHSDCTPNGRPNECDNLNMIEITQWELWRMQSKLCLLNRCDTRTINHLRRSCTHTSIVWKDNAVFLGQGLPCFWLKWNLGVIWADHVTDTGTLFSPTAVLGGGVMS